MGCSPSLINRISTASSIENKIRDEPKFLRFKDQQRQQTNKEYCQEQPLILHSSQSTILRKEEKSSTTQESQNPSTPRLPCIPCQSIVIDNSLQQDHQHPPPQKENLLVEITLPTLQNSSLINGEQNKSIFVSKSKDYLLEEPLEEGGSILNTVSSDKIASNKKSLKMKGKKFKILPKNKKSQLYKKSTSKQLSNIPQIEGSTIILRSKKLDDKEEPKLDYMERYSKREYLPQIQKKKESSNNKKSNIAKISGYHQQYLLLEQREKKRAHRRYQEGFRKSRISSNEDDEITCPLKYKGKTGSIPLGKSEKSRSNKLIINPSFKLNRGTAKKV